MPLLQRVLFLVSLASVAPAHATVVVAGSSAASGLWLVLGAWVSMLPRPVPEVSPHHIRAEPTSAPVRDSCVFVAGMRHCPLPKLGAEPR